eukprot:1756983-Rhodomonas_salina.1
MPGDNAPGRVMAGCNLPDRVCDAHATGLLLTVFTVQFPEWGRFRGAWYSGTATHDPLEQALLASALARSPLWGRLSRWLCEYIARLACERAFPSPRVPWLRLVCRGDAHCRRLARAALLSRQLRRVFKVLPEKSYLAQKYWAWTHTVAAAAGCGQTSFTFSLGRDPCSATLSQANRLHLRGFDKLD